MQAQVNALLARFSPEMAALGGAARRAMRKRFPGWSELVYDNWNALVFGFAPTDRPSDALFSIAVYPRWVRLFFLQEAASLRDPEKRLTGTGKQIRSLVLHSAADLETPAIRDLMQQAMRGLPTPRGRPPVTIIRSVSAKRLPRRPRSRPVQATRTSSSV